MLSWLSLPRGLHPSSDAGVVGKFISFLICPIASQAHWWYASIWVRQTYTIFVYVISYVISHIEDYIRTLRFVKDFTNFLISAIHQHHACLEYITLANLTIQNTTKNREVSKNSCRITQNKCINRYTATHYISFIRDVLLGIPINQTPCFPCRGHRLDPWLGNKDPTCHVAQPEFFF